MRRAFLVNSDKCIGCRGCAMACKSFNQLEPERFWRYVYPLNKEIYPHEERAFFRWPVTTVKTPLVWRRARWKPTPNVMMAWWCITLSAASAVKTVSAIVRMALRASMRKRRRPRSAACAMSDWISA